MKISSLKVNQSEIESVHASNYELVRSKVTLLVFFPLRKELARLLESLDPRSVAKTSLSPEARFCPECCTFWFCTTMIGGARKYDDFRELLGSRVEDAEVKEEWAVREVENAGEWAVDSDEEVGVNEGVPGDTDSCEYGAL